MRMIRTASALIIVLAAASARAAGEKGSATAGLTRRVANAADLPGRCSADRLILATSDEALGTDVPDLPGFKKDLDGPAIEMIASVSQPNSTGLFPVFVKRTDYYNRREAVQKKFEAYIRRLKGKDRARARRNYATLLMYLGEFKAVLAKFAPTPKALAAEKDGRVVFAVAQSYFRLGRYREATGPSRRARKMMPGADLETLWLIMLTDLGRYGRDFYAKHSSEYSVKNIRALFPNEDPDKFPFTDATEASGVQSWAGTGSVAFADLDGRGWDDLLLLSKWFPPKIYRNDAGHFTELPPGPQDRMCSPNLQLLADVDNDGKPDLRRTCCNISGQGPGMLLKNEGGFKFSDISKGSGLETTRTWMLDAWADYDLDGDIDYLAADQKDTVRLFHGNGDGTFTDATEKSGIRTPGSKKEFDFGATGAAWGDYDDDGYPDVFAQGWGWKKLFHNNGDGTFTDVTEKAGIDLGKGEKGYNSFFLDYDDDGRLDLFVGQYVTTSDERWGFGPQCTCSNLLKDDGYSDREWAAAGTLYRNNGDGTFTNMFKTTRFIPLGAMAVNHADWNNDGYQDIVMGTGGPFFQQAEPASFYQNNGNGTFTNLTPYAALWLWGKGHGSAFGDYDHDGNLDFYQNLGGPASGDNWPSVLLHNKGNDNHWLDVSLKAAPGANGMAIGAKVRVFAGGLQQVQVVDSGGAFSAGNSFTLHFGLAGRAKADKVVVEWPDKVRTRTVLTGVDADRAIRVSEKDGSVETLWTSPRPRPKDAAAAAPARP